LNFRLEVEEEEQQRRDIIQQRDNQIDGFIKEQLDEEFIMSSLYYKLLNYFLLTKVYSSGRICNEKYSIIFFE
jgi:hypothetical protein